NAVAVVTGVGVVNRHLGVVGDIIVGLQTMASSVLDKRSIHTHPAVLRSLDADRRDHYAGRVDSYLDWGRLVVRSHDPPTADVFDDSVDDMSSGLCRLRERNLDTIVIEAENHAILDV